MDEANANFEKTLGELRDAYRTESFAAFIADHAKREDDRDCRCAQCESLRLRRKTRRNEELELPSALEGVVEEFAETLKEQMAENDEHLMGKIFSRVKISRRRKKRSACAKRSRRDRLCLFSSVQHRRIPVFLSRLTPWRSFSRHRQTVIL